MVESKLCLIDASSLFYRAFYAIKSELVTSGGQPTNAVFGFVRMLARILEDVAPQYMAVCFDVGRVTHRTQRFASYKIHRPPMPPELVSQVPYIKELVGAYRLRIFELEGYEADDLIASLAHQMREKVDKVVIVSSDKDILQMVGANVEVYNPYKGEGVVFTPQLVKDKFGVAPRKIRDLIALMGDASDNIPGAKGIGEKTARELLGTFEGVDEIIANTNQIERPRLRRIIEENRDVILLSKELAILKEDLPLHCRLADLKLLQPDRDKLWDLFSRLEFKGMLKQLSQDATEAPEAGSPVAGSLCEVPRKPVTDARPFLASVAKQRLFAFFLQPREVAADALDVNVALDEGCVYGLGDVATLKELFSHPEWTAVGYDIKQAKHHLSRHGIPMRTRFFDSRIAAHLVDSSRSTANLEGLLWEHLSLKGLSRAGYLGKESHYILRVKEVLESALRKKGILKLFQEVETPLVDVLFEMESSGVRLDLGVLADLSGELDKKQTALTEEIYSLADCTFNVNSPKQLREVLFEKLKLPVVKRTKTGASTDEEVLTKLARVNKLPRVLLEYRQITKLKTTYADALPILVDRQTGKIRSTFNQTGTETGRLSSRDPNLQNIPIKTVMGRKVRQAFIPSEGFDCLISADYSQIELRILAHMSEDEALMEAFLRDRDIHRTTASLIFSVGEAEVSAEMRENAKRVNFGIVYGMSGYGLAKDLGISPKMAESFIEEYFMRYPKVKSFLDAQIEFVQEKGYVATLLGRRRYIPEINNRNPALRQFAQRQAINAPIQGSAADLIKRAMVDVSRRLREEGFVSRLILQVHDELVFEVKEKEREGLARLVKEAMEGALKLNVPIRVKISLGKNWLQTKNS